MNIKMKAGMGVIGLGAVYAALAVAMPKAAIGNPMAPKIFPMALGVGLVILGALYFMKESVAYKEQVAKEGIKEVDPKTAELDKKTNKLIILTSVAGIGYALFFEHLGYVISTTVFLSVILFAINGKKDWKLNLSVAVVFSVAVYVLFFYVLAIPLPMMPILEI